MSVTGSIPHVLTPTRDEIRVRRLLIALYAFLGAVAAGLPGAATLWLLRHRSLVVSLTVVVAVAVTAMLAGTLSVAWAMFLSLHDLTVVTNVVCALKVLG